MSTNSDKIKVAFIASPLGFKGGTFRHLLNWCTFFDKSKFQIALFCSWASAEDKEQGDTYFQNIEGIKYYSTNWLHPISNFFKYGVSEISKVLKNFKPDIIHTVFIQPDILMSILSSKIGSPIHVSSWEGALVGKKLHSRLKLHLYSMAFRLIQSKISTFVSISEATAKENSLDYGVPKHKIKTIYSGLDLAQFNNIKSTFTNPPLVGLISRLSAEKEVEIFIKSIPEILQVFPDTKFEIIGDGPEKEKLQNLSASLGLTSKLSFRGWCQNIADVLPSLDIFVFTSGGEGLPWCILEAQACGVPLIASSVGGIPEIIKAGTNGLLAESNTPECFASGIMSLLKNPDNAMKMAKNGRDKVESHFNIQREVTEIGNLYQKLVSEIS